MTTKNHAEILKALNEHKGGQINKKPSERVTVKRKTQENNVIEIEQELPFIEEKETKNGSIIIHVNHVRLAKHLLKEENIYKNNTHFMYFDQNEGVWRSDTHSYLKKRMIEKLGEHYTISRANQTIDVIEHADYQQNSNDVFDKESYAITLANGTYYMNEKGKPGLFVPEWNPEDYSTTKVSINYDVSMYEKGDTEPINTYAFLSVMLEKEEIDFIFEWLGFCLIKDYPLQKFLVLHGAGGNGKSTLINFITAVLGEKNVSNISLHTLENEKFGRAHLKGKLLNGCADIDDSFFNSSAFLKGLTGNDMIYAEHKGIDGFSFKNFAKLIFSANKLPSFKDTTDGLQRRPIVLPMDKKPKEKDNDFTLEQIVNDPEELSRILYHAIASIEKVLQRKAENSGDFSITEKMEDALKQWFEKMDNVITFADECCTLESTEKAMIQEVYTRYNWYCRDNNYKPLGKNNFVARLRERYDLEKKKTNKGWMLVGIKLND